MWGYDESNDPILESVFDRAVDAGINLFDTADSYGTGNGLVITGGPVELA